MEEARTSTTTPGPGPGPCVRVRCRICWDTCNQQPDSSALPFSPCKCRGSMGLVHGSCLRMWLMSRFGAALKEARCELCTHPLHIRVQPKPLLSLLRCGRAPPGWRRHLLHLVYALVLSYRMAIVLLSLPQQLKERKLARLLLTLVISAHCCFFLSWEARYLWRVLVAFRCRHSDLYVLDRPFSSNPTVRILQ